MILFSPGAFLVNSLSGFSFRKNSEGEKEVSTDGGTTWENFNSGASADLLWTNPNPHASFASQTISLDLSEYEYVLVVPNSDDSTENAPYSSVLAKVEPTDNANFKYYVMSQSYFRAQAFKDFNGNSCRAFIVTKTGVQFSAGGFNSIQRNTWCIPYKIYGIKSIKWLE